MLQQNQNSWNKKWQAQMDKAHQNLLNLVDLQTATEWFLEQVHENIRMQIALMELIDAQIKPKAPE